MPRTTPPSTSSSPQNQLNIHPSWFFQYPASEHSKIRSNQLVDASTSPKQGPINLALHQLDAIELEVNSSTISLTVARALREIKFYQPAATAKSTLIPKTSFARLVREIAKEIKDGINSHFAKEY